VVPVTTKEDRVGTPVWLRAFNAVEGAVGPRVEEFVHGETFSTSLVLVQKVKRGVKGQVERRTRQVWHLVNLPAGTDVRRLRGQVGDLDHEVRALRSTLEREKRARARRERSSDDE
jgi:hypothetical protein